MNTKFHSLVGNVFVEAVVWAERTVRKQIRKLYESAFILSQEIRVHSI